MNKLKIGIVGCGAIGSSLAKVIVKDFAKEARLCGFYDLNKAKSENLSKKLSGGTSLVTASFRQLVAKSELVIEAASAKVSWDVAKYTLAHGKDIMIMSVGGVATRLKQLTALAKKNGGHVYIPSGALSGIDAVKAASRGKIKKITLSTTKHPLSFKGVKFIEDKGIKLSGIKKDTLLFSGTAAEAVKFFPQNINVAAVLGLAGIGVNKTIVRIIASPKVTRNIHEIKVEADAGNMSGRTENILHPDNPKTSFLAVLSAVAMIKQILEPVKIGT